VQPAANEQVQYATLGWRAAAVILDTLLVLIVSSVVLAVLMAAGVLDIGLSGTATLEEIVNASRTAPGWLMPLEYGLVFLYFTLFELSGATPGKRLFKLSVTAENGGKATPVAVLVRNVVRIPEMYLLYVPSAVSCLVSGRRRRLGDFVAHTVVVRRVPVAAAARGGVPAGPPPPPAVAPSSAPPVASAAAAAQPAPPSPAEALAALKTAALVVRGAHHNYLRFSEIELARGAAPPAGAGQEAHEAPPQPGSAAEDVVRPAQPAPPPASEADVEEFTPEYVAAWYTLADAVMALQQAHAAAQLAAASAGTTLAAACAEQPDLLYLFRELEPYFTADSDEGVHEAYLRVARSEHAG
jgi:uncharacterized RDD family membrane protein YckC